MTADRALAPEVQKLFSLTGRVALVTGATQGLGLAIARIYAQAGARVHIGARKPELAAAAVARLKSEGLDVASAVFDVDDAAAGEAAIDRIVAEAGSLDILVNNAGVRDRMPIADISEAKFHDVLQTNLAAPFALSKRAAAKMAVRGWGRIIMVTSVAGQRGMANIAAYSASKGGLAALMRTFAAAYARDGVTCNALMPGSMQTEFNAEAFSDEKFAAWVVAKIPAGRLGQAADIAGAALFLASDASSFINGVEMAVDGGQTISV